MLEAASQRLGRNKDKILKAWELRANCEVLASMGLEELALRESLPELLDQIAGALSTTVDRTEVRVSWDRSESLRVGKQQGRERAVSRSYTMDQMISEYHILRQVLCDVMEEEAPLSAVEREVIVCAVEQAVNDAATQFSETLHKIQETLASTLTHDLRGPLTTAKLTAQMILRRPDDLEHSVRAGERICTSMDRLSAMLQDLLDASMIRAGERLPLQREECDLDAVTAEVAQELNFTVGNRFVVVSPGPVTGYWSRNGLRRIVENLATNAAKYGAPDTPITLTLRQDPTQVTLAVHNQGEPIPSEEQSTLFQQFRRAKAAQSLGGWGLGLAVVKGLVEAHQGTVNLSSSAGRGTTFTVQLPR